MKKPRQRLLGYLRLEHVVGGSKMQQRIILSGIPGNAGNDDALNGISDDVVLYKYFSCETFCQFIKSHSLKFATPTNWDDKFEGRRYNFFEQGHRAEHYRATCWTLEAEDVVFRYGDDPAMCKAAINDLDEFGHAAMWGSFCRDGGVRIRSTYGKLKKLFIESLPPGEIWAGKVRYEPESRWKSLPGTTDHVGQLFIKGVSFRHEAEFRFVYRPENMKCSDEFYLPIDNPYELIDEFLVAPESANSTWGARELYLDCVDKFSTRIPGPTNEKNGAQHCRISQLYGNISCLLSLFLIFLR